MTREGIWQILTWSTAVAFCKEVSNKEPVGQVIRNPQWYKDTEPVLLTAAAWLQVHLVDILLSVEQVGHTEQQRKSYYVPRTEQRCGLEWKSYNPFR